MARRNRKESGLSDKSPARSDSRQRARFIKAAREAGASEDLGEFDENLHRIATTKAPAKKDEKDS